MKSPVEVTGGEVEVRLLESRGTLMVFAFNHTDAAVAPTIKVAGKSFQPKLEPQGIWFGEVPAR